MNAANERPCSAGPALATLLATLLAVMLVGCGGSEPTTGVTKVDPQIGQRHHEMDDFMKNNKPTANKSKATRNHP